MVKPGRLGFGDVWGSSGLRLRGFKGFRVQCLGFRVQDLELQGLRV